MLKQDKMIEKCTYMDFDSSTAINGNFCVNDARKLEVKVLASVEPKAMGALKMSKTNEVSAGQLVRLMAIYDDKISVDWGKVLKISDGDIYLKISSNSGASGGPVIDREGKIIGVLSSSHDQLIYSCAKDLRHLTTILSSDNSTSVWN